MPNDTGADIPAMSIIGYDPAGAWERPAANTAELLEHRNPAGNTWININTLDHDAVSALAAEYRIHPLTVEDILDTDQRPKAEEFDDYLFITLKAVHRETGYEQISIILTEDTLITFQEKPGDNFGGIRKRIMNNAGRIRRFGVDYLAYALMDAVADGYFLVLDSLSDTIEALEDRTSGDTDDCLMADIQKTKQILIHLRRSIWPLRDSISRLIHSDSSLLHEGLAPFFQDLHGNIIQAAETIESHRELIAGIIEVNLSSVSNRTNRIMKVLTIISTIFIPLTFIAGVYGMNFTHMPELHYAYSYPVIWGIMILIAAGMLYFFKRRRWI
ncbi:MAG: magnesium/cobalt transporter CorA [Spirochaetaceae bacterium]|jgi:magnesium transporter|nr:magnesium/cobalt transporter CorA [Spirochaetaceae bacterium]